MFRISAFSRRRRLVAASLALAVGLCAGGAQAAPVSLGVTTLPDPALIPAHDEGYGYDGGRHRGGERGWGGGHGGWDHHRGRGHERHGWGHRRNGWGHHHHHRGYDRY